MIESENMQTVYPNKWKLRMGVMILISGSIAFVSKVDLKGRESYVTMVDHEETYHM